jgi:hypothetical protein
MLSQAELNAMPRLTATGVAEERFERLGRTMRLGPSGLPVPRATAMYRPSESALLSKLHSTAFGAYERKVLPWERVQQIAAMLVADIERRYPHAEMVVLEKYGHAKKYCFLDISLGNHLRHKIDLAEPILAIGKAVNFTVDPIRNTDVAVVPDSTREFFTRVADLEQERSDMRFGTGILAWPATFRRRTQRMPKWREIEDAWPIVGNWLAEERSKMEKPRG